MKQIKYLIVCLQGSPFLRCTYCNMNVQDISYQKLKHEAIQCLFHDAAFISYQYDLEYQIYDVEVVKW